LILSKEVDVIHSDRARAAGYVILFAALAAAVPASVPAQAIIGTVNGSNQAIVFPSPGTGLPNPTKVPVTGLAISPQPHGVGYFGSDNAMVSDFGLSRVYVVQISTATVLATINTTGKYNGTGSIAIAPGLTAALASGGATSVAVIQAPFNASSTITNVTLPGAIAGYQTEAIVFNAAGRAFVYHSTGVSVLDPPYSSVAFTIPVANSFSGSIAITPSGNNLLCSDGSTTIRIFTAPYSALSTPVNLTAPAQIDGMMATPDGTKVLAVSYVTAGGVYAISAPYTASSTIETLPVSATFGTFEDVGISADGQLAIIAGNGGGNAATPFIQAPFTTAGATVSNVTITGGRGNGAVRFLPPGLAPGLTISKSGPGTASSGSQITYTITYGNTGSANAANVVIKDPVPAGTTFVSATNGGTNVAGTVTWNIGTVNAGVTGQTVQFTVLVTATGGSIDNVNYTIEGTGISPIPGPPVSTTIGGGGATPTPTATVTPTITQGVAVVVPMLSWPAMMLLLLGITAAALLLLKR
jgi:uncharacterized repeat protein (TIGR01451 family)